MSHGTPINCRRVPAILGLLPIRGMLPTLGLLPSLGMLAVVGLASLLGLRCAHGAPAPGAALEDIPHLESLARSAAGAELGTLTDKQRLLVGPVQPNLQLERCPTPIKPLVGPGRHMKDRVMIELRCAATGAQTNPLWHLYVQARVVGVSTVAVAAHAIVVGSVLTAADLRTEQHDVSELPLGFLDDPAIAVGLTAARPIAGGTPMTNQMLVAAKAVQRGQSVTLLADVGGMSIRMAGRALSDGLLNQRVKVQNLSSGKIVEGVARSSQVVEIIFQ